MDETGHRRSRQCGMKLVALAVLIALGATCIVLLGASRRPATAETPSSPTTEPTNPAANLGSSGAPDISGTPAQPDKHVSSASQSRLPSIMERVDTSRIEGRADIFTVVTPAVVVPGAGDEIDDGNAIEDMIHTDGSNVNSSGCFMNHTYFKELSGKYSMPFGERSEEVSLRACQLRCANTPGCEHFSYWNDGGCHLTSYTAYSQPFNNLDSTDVISGPRSCAEVFPETSWPTVELEAVLNFSSHRAQEAQGCGGLHSSYDLSWKAEGQSFFDDWQFTTLSETHGAEWYLNKTDAFRAGVALPTEGGAILRIGDQIYPFKRRSVMLRSAQAWRPDKGFVVAMKYKHVPYGAGIWPAFWLMNSDKLWPKGGELDILEYANDFASKVTFHTDKNCSLNTRKMNECMRKEGMDVDTIESCYTNYTGNELGCKPKQIRRTGEWFSNNPGVIAVAWDASGVSVFHIPEAEIPADLLSDHPNPNSWGNWMLAFLPFDADSCMDVAWPQEIVLNIALCGDWAGGAWYTSPEAKKTGFLPPYCIPGHVSEPATDCCTIFMSSPTVEDYLKTRAYFDIDYVKVFEPTGMTPTKISSGTYRNEGLPLTEPCIKCGEVRWIPKGSLSGGNVCCPGCGSNATYYWNDVCNCGGTLICNAASSEV